MPEASNAIRRIWVRQWWIVILVCAVSIAATAFFTAREPQIYQSSATMVVTPNSSIETTSELLRSLDTLERRTVIATFARIPATRESRELAAEKLGLDVGDLRSYRINASVLPYTNIIKIDVEGPDPSRVADVANAAASATGRRARQMYSIYKLQPLAEAAPSRRPMYPDPQRNYVVAAVLGLFLGVGLAFVADQRRPGPTKA